MHKKRPGNTWNLIQRIFFVIFLVHSIWFAIFIFQKFSVTDFPVTNLKAKVLGVCAAILVIGLLYFFWLRHIAAVKMAGIVFKQVFFILYITSFIYLVLGMVFNPPLTITQSASILKGHGLKRDYVSYQNMGVNIKLAVMAAEDQLFPDHDGFDLKAIKRAVKYNRRHPDKLRGASTISQQTAKNVFLWQGGGFIRKGLEVYFTFSIEKCWTKKMILERYLNIAEMGKGIFGVQAAAKAYFNKDASALTKAEAAQIAAALPNPVKYSVKPLGNYVAGRANGILRQMNNLESDPDVQAILR